IVYLTSMGSQFNEKSNLYIKWNVSSSKGHFGHVATFRGNITKLTMPKVASGEEVEVELEMQVSFYKKDENNTPTMLIDTANMICLIGGRDIWADLRSHVI
ncbi:MAG: phage major tail tube protein, partial [Helicobacter sp.]|nr:phage major tail tube protein [Helicobacter sp.]